jgi:hypothetical protein
MGSRVCSRSKLVMAQTMSTSGLSRLISTKALAWLSRSRLGKRAVLGLSTAKAAFNRW